MPLTSPDCRVTTINTVTQRDCGHQLHYIPGPVNPVHEETCQVR